MFFLGFPRQSGRAFPAAFLRPQHRGPGSSVGHRERVSGRHTRLRRQDRDRHRRAADSHAGKQVAGVGAVAAVADVVLVPALIESGADLSGSCRCRILNAGLTGP